MRAARAVSHKPRVVAASKATIMAQARKEIGITRLRLKLNEKWNKIDYSARLCFT
jgi:hypothetical protein